MAYQALYRTYRPKDFDEVAGQSHITKTFKNALVNNKLSHAYLFSGPRGTGKTSVAKIIAKAVNCEHAPTSNPCNTCSVCEAINKNAMNDVIEIDAASNNGVDEIREIRDKVKYLPGIGNYKVYIIDEVHMLSTGAFNALLKTLEEPPKHVIFILATTEPHKVPSTIHSRCQRFDFRGVDKKSMIDHLNHIIDAEGIAINEDAIKLICDSAEGGMRDAVSLLDQVVSYTEDEINVDDIHAIRGSLSQDSLLDIAEAVFQQDVVKALASVEKLSDEGKESQNIMTDLIGFYRDALLLKSIKNIDDDKAIFKQERFISLVEKLSNAKLFKYMDILNDIRQTMRYAQKGKLYVELALIKMSDQEIQSSVKYQEDIDDLHQTVDDLSAKLHALENDILTLSEEGVAKQEAQPKEKTPADQAFDDYEAKSKSTEQTSKDTALTSEDSASDASEGQDDSVKPESLENEVLNAYQKLYNKYSQKSYKTFDIQYVEDVLNTGDRGARIDMVKKWYDIERFVDASELKYAKMITDGKLVATNGTMIIVEYETPTICNRLMKPQIKSQLLSVLERFFERKMMFLALPEDVWAKIQTEFVEKHRKRKEPNDKIKLTPIEHSRLIEIPDSDESYDDLDNQSVKKAQDLFGDIVKVKKGETS